MRVIFVLAFLFDVANGLQGCSTIPKAMISSFPSVQKCMVPGKIQTATNSESRLNHHNSGSNSLLYRDTARHFAVFPLNQLLKMLLSFMLREYDEPAVAGWPRFG
jgi:hypothetical protein